MSPGHLRPSARRFPTREAGGMNDRRPPTPSRGVEEFISRPLHRMYVGGAWTNGTTGYTIDVSSPSDGSGLGAFPLAGPGDVGGAVGAARGAVDGGWRRMGAAQ